MSQAQGAAIRFLIIAAGTVAAFFIADYIGLKVLGLFIPPDAQGRYTVSAITPGHGYAAAISTLANVVVLALLVAALLWAIYARRPMDRAIIIAGGYVVACLAAALLLLFSTAVFSHLTRDPGGIPSITRSGLEQFASSFSIVLSLGSAIGLFALLPALPVIVHTERKRIRSLPYYLIAGALTGIVSLALALALFFAPTLSAWLTGTLPSSAAQGRSGAALMILGWALMFVPPGLGAGFTYWLIAGRTAGGNAAAAEAQAG
ncbi:MAG: hypothetical protein HC869_02305 [Rhodospirillales bacterium]|nr:hypothetical protein [Rhodospirillales bacterium]